MDQYLLVELGWQISNWECSHVGMWMLVASFMRSFLHEVLITYGQDERCCFQGFCCYERLDAQVSQAPRLPEPLICFLFVEFGLGSYNCSYVVWCEQCSSAKALIRQYLALGTRNNVSSLTFVVYTLIHNHSGHKTNYGWIQQHFNG